MSPVSKEFNAAIRGYHPYKKYWNPKPSEKLIFSHEIILLTYSQLERATLKVIQLVIYCMSFLEWQSFYWIEVLILLLFLLK